MSHEYSAIGTDTDSGLNAISNGNSADVITIPDAQLLFSGDFKRSGTDLILSDPAHDFVVHDYFRSEKRATLASPDGATLSGTVVEALAGHVQYAQAGATPGANAATPIGRVAKVEGGATAIRNGVAVTLNAGDAVNKGDVIQTAGDSNISISFTDGTALNLSASTRMALNEFVYDANSTSNSGVFSLVQGGFAFVAGQVAKTGGLNIETPVATMGIRGTVGGGSCADAGNCEFYAAPDLNGQPSTYTLLTGGTFINGQYVGGTVVGTVTVGASVGYTSTGQVTFLSADNANPAIAALAHELVLNFPQFFPTQPTQTPNTQPGSTPGSGTPPPPPPNDNPDDPTQNPTLIHVTLVVDTGGQPDTHHVDLPPPPPPPPPAAAPACGESCADD